MHLDLHVVLYWNTYSMRQITESISGSITPFKTDYKWVVMQSMI